LDKVLKMRAIELLNEIEKYKNVKILFFSTSVINLSFKEKAQIADIGMIQFLLSSRSFIMGSIIWYGKDCGEIPRGLFIQFMKKE
jgi:hypothetical protein